ncbi:MAG TPA: hypothetical protein VK174_14035 [Chitinophagales bacterium]|nr:hypothetical protein [Chitinophagales bacterium]
MYTLLLCKVYQAYTRVYYQLCMAMWKDFQKKISKMPWWMTNPFFITTIVFGTWMIFFDESNLISQYRKHRELSALLEKKKFYTDQIKETDKAYSELTTNPATQEKFAREHYWMKRDNEDVFVIVEK